MQSIKQNFNFKTRLPDLQNLGICLRVLIIVNLLAFIAATMRTESLSQILPAFASIFVALMPIFILSLLSIYPAYPFLRKLPYWQGVTSVFAVVFSFTTILYFVASYIPGLDYEASLARALFLAFIFTAVAVTYFHMRDRALSPAVTEARLQALQARIRPHFLFNCINAVLSIVRSNPKRAETALEDMADLFRVLMADNRELVPLAQELDLCRQYLELEKLRLDERLNVIWDTTHAPSELLIPPLILQPLVENAVYHGIEPLPEGGTIEISIRKLRNEVQISLTNPYTATQDHHAGNKMALGNIKERLALHFDAEARLTSKQSDHEYRVDIIIPV